MVCRLGAEGQTSGLRSIAVTTLAHLVASAVFILLLQLYTRTHPGKEGWPALIPALMTAFALETVFLFLVVGLQRGAAVLWKLSLAVLVSWIAGVASFSSLDTLAGSSPIKPPMLSWLLSLAILFIMVKRLDRIP